MATIGIILMCVNTLRQVIINHKQIKLLIADGYMEVDGLKKRSITYKGILFNENSGYEQRFIAQANQMAYQTLALWLTATGTGLAGLYGLKELSVWFYHLCGCH